ncbi:hypothetical protein IFM89_005599 [Coptis chinensis]|uniref:C2H2-type domain-containing protein n=1 Tax=Coptis chinensis TaxID=261450 RepID=A0A835LZB3_9MAGN|nr:hypothetical protein IFM89_005599 [Coptis chinensis]
MCGRALGGHMRAHGIGDENYGHVDDEDPVSDWEEGRSPPSNKRMYSLRTNANRLKSCRTCENCGKEFSSWKSFLEHGKCSSVDVEALVSSPDFDDEDGTRRGCGNWSKGKRTRRVQVDDLDTLRPYSEEEDLANCLVMLSNAQTDPFLAKGVAKGLFECKACKKVFTSHQALGGHRASHKKVKGCFAARQDEPDESLMDEDVINDEYSFMPKSTTILPSENALNSHWASLIRENRKFTNVQYVIEYFRQGKLWVVTKDQVQQFHPKTTFNKFGHLDLNLPAPVDDNARNRQDQKRPLSFQVPKEIFLQPWIGVEAKNDNDNSHNYYHNDNENDNPSTNIVDASLPISVDDEADSKVKLAKLSDLKDVNTESGSSQWLQVGIGTSTNVSGADP